MRRWFVTKVLDALDKRRREMGEQPDRYVARRAIDDWLLNIGLSKAARATVRPRLYRHARTLARRQQISMREAVNRTTDLYLSVFRRPLYAYTLLAAIEEGKLAYRLKGSRNGNILFEDAGATLSLFKLLAQHIRMDDSLPSLMAEAEVFNRMVAVIEWMADSFGHVVLYAPPTDDVLSADILVDTFWFWSRFGYREIDLPLCWETACMLRRDPVLPLLARHFLDLYGPEALTALHRLLEERKLDKAVLNTLLLHSKVFENLPSTTVVTSMIEAVRDWDEAERPDNGLIASVRCATSKHGLQVEAS